MNRTLTLPDALTEDDLWLVEQTVAKLAAIRAEAAELARREAEKTARIMELLDRETD